MTIYPTTTYTPTELKKRITVRKFDEDGRVTEEIVTEEYGDKEIVQIPIYPTNPTPWYQPNYITC